MEMSGEQLIPAPQQTVWDALNDPQMLKACVPGCACRCPRCARGASIATARGAGSTCAAP